MLIQINEKMINKPIEKWAEEMNRVDKEQMAFNFMKIYKLKIH